MHPRAAIVRTAQTDLQKVIGEWLERHDLTTVEELAVLNHTLSGTIGGTLKFAIRQERHGDDDTPGDEAPQENGRHHREEPEPTDV